MKENLRKPAGETKTVFPSTQRFPELENGAELEDTLLL